MPNNISIYIGAPIDYTSELTAFTHIYQLVQQQNVKAIIIANANIDTTQVDLIVIFEKAACVIEVKGTRTAIRGNTNGKWERKTSAAYWGTTGNYYLQTLTAKHVVKDALTRITGKQAGYPDSMLLLVPGLQPGSQIPAGDFKVRTQSLTDLSILESGNDMGCNFSDWRKLITHFNLQAVSTAAAVTSPQIFEKEQMLENYRSFIIRYYQEDISRFVPVRCAVGGQEISSDDLPTALDPFRNFLITGPSGCAKTLLAKAILVRYAQQGELAIYLAAKHFEKSINAMLKEEMVFTGIPSVGVFLSAAAALGKRISLIVDGLNECLPTARETLIRALYVLCNRYDLTIILVSQNREEAVSKLDLVPIEVMAPSEEVRRTITSLTAGPESFDKLEPMIQAVKTGLEADIIGKMGLNSLGKKSRFALLEFFVRTRLGENATEGLRYLSKFGAYLSERLAYSVSLRQFDSLADEPSLLAVKRLLVASNVLQVKFDRISFSHELFMNAFIADNIVRTTGFDTALLQKEIAAPKNHDKRELILGAIEDYETEEAVLNQTDSVELLLGIYQGAAGEFSRQWINRRLLVIIEKIKEECLQIDFEVTGNTFREIQVRKNTLLDWTPPEIALIYTLPELLARGEFLEIFFGLIPLVDQAQDRFLNTKAPGDPQRGLSWKDNLFQAAYIRSSDTQSAVCRIFSSIDSGFYGLKFNYRESDRLVSKLVLPHTLTDGQLHFLLAINRFNDGGDILYPFIIERITFGWERTPYHLRLRLMESAKYYRDFAEKKAELLDILNVLLEKTDPGQLFESSSIFEAYQSLGGTDDDEIAYEHTVRHELETVLAESDTNLQRQNAFGMYYKQFDHPYGSAYCNVLYGLTDEARKEFLILAVQGAEGGLFTMPAIIELAELSDASCCPYFEKWRNVPPEKTSYPQGDMNIFFATHVLLARFAYPIPSMIDSYTTTRDKTLCATGEIFYWVNRSDMDVNSRKQACKEAWGYLLSTGSMLTAEAIWLTSFSVGQDFSNSIFREPPVQLISDIFPHQLLEAGRICLEEQRFEQGFFPWDKKEEILRHTIHMLESFGTLGDIALLKKFIHDTNFGVAAVEAIKKIHARCL